MASFLVSSGDRRSCRNGLIHITGEEAASLSPRHGCLSAGICQEAEDRLSAGATLLPQFGLLLLQFSALMLNLKPGSRLQEGSFSPTFVCGSLKWPVGLTRGQCEQCAPYSRLKAKTSGKKTLTTVLLFSSH